MEGDYYTTGEAARILKVSEARIRQLLGSEELEGSRDPVTERWKIPQHAVHARLEKRRSRETPSTSADAREWIERAQTLERELGRLEGRLELTEQTQSSIREERNRLLAERDRERERADQERREREQERIEAQRVLEKLQEELEEARLSWWKKLFR